MEEQKAGNRFNVPSSLVLDVCRERLQALNNMLFIIGEEYTKVHKKYFDYVRELILELEGWEFTLNKDGTEAEISFRRLE